ncbi:hypothetical protein DICVIV_02113 [Dictyocaulus viviparus]|uniref:Uncharacterized protein n=1 Tax=Dictyocaulus viviparus TaxID=29172 RepID=A0A0D8Y683_DICVI|nr:hypothetical protein DICVIV_02113 [Dictyocaulus viviparus]
MCFIGFITEVTFMSQNILLLVHECNLQLALFRNATQGIGTSHDGASLRREVETAGRACLKACEAAKNCVLPQLRHEGVEFTRHASQFIGCVAAYVVEMKRCVALEKTFPAPTEPSITPQQWRLCTNMCRLQWGTYCVVDVLLTVYTLSKMLVKRKLHALHAVLSFGGWRSIGYLPSKFCIGLRDAESIIANMESMLVTLENLITVHFSTSESSPTDKPRRVELTMFNVKNSNLLMSFPAPYLLSLPLLYYATMFILKNASHGQMDKPTRTWTTLIHHQQQFDKKVKTLATYGSSYRDRQLSNDTTRNHSVRTAARK